MTIREYVPRRLLRNGHLMTVYCWARRRTFPRLPAPVERFFDVAAGTRVLAHCYWQPDAPCGPALIALHGLEGSSRAHYMLGLADKALTAGFSVILLNQRNCGGTEQFSPGLYHSGLTADVDYVLRELVATEGLSRVAVAGYSLGGNLALKLAGDYGPDAPAALRAVCAVSPIFEVSACVHALERPANIGYQWNFVRGLRNRMRRKDRHHPGAFPINQLGRVRSVRRFDDLFTAPHFGFAGAEDYYHRVSAARVVERIAVPTLIISAADDPFVPASLFDAPALRNNPAITTMVTPHGGHCGFVSEAREDDGYWAEAAAVAFARDHV